MSEQKLLYIKFKSGQSRTYSVVGRLSDFGISVFQHDITTKNGLSDEFQDNKGYIDENGDIWIYRKNLPSMSGITSMPIPWFNMYDEIVGDEIRTTITWNKRCHAKTKALFCEKNTSSMDVSSIAEITDPNVPLSIMIFLINNFKKSSFFSSITGIYFSPPAFISSSISLL